MDGKHVIDICHKCSDEQVSLIDLNKHMTSRWAVSVFESDERTDLEAFLWLSMWLSLFDTELVAGLGSTFLLKSPSNSTMCFCVVLLHLDV